MKWILPLLLVLVSCKGADDMPTKTYRRFDPVDADPGMMPTLSQICTSLGVKEGNLDILSGKVYTFSLATKACGQSSYSPAQDVQVTIENGAFKPLNGSLFPFRLELRSTGIMSSICNTAIPQNPTQVASYGSAIWYSTAESKYCHVSNGTACFYAETGSSSDGVDYLINRYEWIKFSLGGARQGFFVERTLRTSVGCNEGEFQEFSTTLK